MKATSQIISLHTSDSTLATFKMGFEDRPKAGPQHSTKSRSQTPSEQSDSDANRRKSTRTGTKETSSSLIQPPSRITVSAPYGDHRRSTSTNRLSELADLATKQSQMLEHELVPKASLGTSKLGRLSLEPTNAVDLSPVKKTKGLKRKKTFDKDPLLILVGSSISALESAPSVSDNESSNDDSALVNQITPKRRKRQIWTPDQDLVVFDIFSRNTTLTGEKKLNIWKEHFSTVERSYRSLKDRWDTMQGDGTTREDLLKKIAQQQNESGSTHDSYKDWSLEEQYCVAVLAAEEIEDKQWIRRGHRFNKRFRDGHRSRHALIAQAVKLEEQKQAPETLIKDIADFAAIEQRAKLLDVSAQVEDVGALGKWARWRDEEKMVVLKVRKAHPYWSREQQYTAYKAMISDTFKSPTVKSFDSFCQQVRRLELEYDAASFEEGMQSPKPAVWEQHTPALRTLTKGYPWPHEQDAALWDIWHDPVLKSSEKKADAFHARFSDQPKRSVNSLVKRVSQIRHFRTAAQTKQTQSPQTHSEEQMELPNTPAEYEQLPDVLQEERVQLPITSPPNQAQLRGIFSKEQAYLPSTSVGKKGPGLSYGKRYEVEENLMFLKIHEAHPYWTYPQKYDAYLQEVRPLEARSHAAFSYQLGKLINDKWTVAKLSNKSAGSGTSTETVGGRLGPNDTPDWSRLARKQKGPVGEEWSDAQNKALWQIMNDPEIGSDTQRLQAFKERFQESQRTLRSLQTRMSLIRNLPAKPSSP